jgi:hypothetical protein
LNELNIIVKQDAYNLDLIAIVFNKLKHNLPESESELTHCFKFMIEEGVIFNISLLLNKLRIEQRSGIIVHSTY